MRFGWRFWIDFPRFYFAAIRLVILLLAAEFLAIPGPWFWESCDSRFCAAKALDFRLLSYQSGWLKVIYEAMMPSQPSQTSCHRTCIACHSTSLGGTDLLLLQRCSNGTIDPNILPPTPFANMTGRKDNFGFNFRGITKRSANAINCHKNPGELTS